MVNWKYTELVVARFKVVLQYWYEDTEEYRETKAVRITDLVEIQTRDLCRQNCTWRTSSCCLCQHCQSSSPGVCTSCFCPLYWVLPVSSVARRSCLASYPEVLGSSLDPRINVSRCSSAPPFQCRYTSLRKANSIQYPLKYTIHNHLPCDDIYCVKMRNN
jgi:hypothetical protein